MGFVAYHDVQPPFLNMMSEYEARAGDLNITFNNFKFHNEKGYGVNNKGCRYSRSSVIAYLCIVDVGSPMNSISFGFKSALIRRTHCLQESMPMDLFMDILNPLC